MTSLEEGLAPAQIEPRNPRLVQRIDLVTALLSTAVACAALLIAILTRIDPSEGLSISLFTAAPLGAAVALVALWFCGRAFDDVLLRWFAAGLAIALPAMVLQLVSFPLVAPGGGVLGTDGDSSAALYLLFHLGPALGAVLGVRHVRTDLIAPVIGVGVLLAVALAANWIPLPTLLDANGRYLPVLIALEWATAALVLGSALLWMRSVGRSPSGLHAWVGVMLFVSTYDVAFNALGEARFTPIWWSSLLMRAVSYVVLAGGCLAWLLVSLRASERYGEQEISRREGQLGVAFGLTRRLLGVSEQLSSGISLDEVCERVVDLTRTGTGVRQVAIRVVGEDAVAVAADPVLKALLDVSLDGPDGPVRELVLCRDRHQVQRLLRGRLVGYDVETAAIVPLRSVTGVVAHVVLWSPAERRWSHDDEQFLGGLGTQAGQAVTRALAYEAMAGAANTLQESLLPARLPDIVDLQLLSAYRAVTAGSSVGGDWFDCIRVSDRQVALVIGDVMGKGFRAAAAMGQVRTALRAAAAYDPNPAAVLASLDTGVLELEDDEIVTLAYALLDLDTGRLGVARAGHPPLVIAHRDGSVETVEDGGSPPIGWHEVARAEAWTTLERGSALVLYTDGLVEVRRRSLDEGIDALVDAVGALHRTSGVDPEGWAAWLDSLQARDDWQDDVAVLIGLYL